MISGSSIDVVIDKVRPSINILLLVLSSFLLIPLILALRVLVQNGEVVVQVLAVAAQSWLPLLQLKLLLSLLF